jgi:hypothetical protein
MDLLCANGGGTQFLRYICQLDDMDGHGQRRLCLIATGKQTRYSRLFNVVCFATKSGYPITEVFRYVLNMLILYA